MAAGLSACVAPAAGGRWTTATDAVASMEGLIRAQARKLQDQYRSIVEAEGTPNCAAQDMCDATFSGFSAGDPHLESFVDSRGTCVNLDLDASGHILEPAVTGRNVLASPNAGDKCVWSSIEEAGSSAFRQTWTADSLGRSSKFADLNAQGCTSPSDLGSCKVNVNPSVYGFSVPCQGNPCTASIAQTDQRLQSEICATNTLTPDFQSTWTDYNQTTFSFLGMQETGLYRTWPTLYQCRTEAVCSGCSDPRYRCECACLLPACSVGGLMLGVVCAAGGGTPLLLADRRT